MLSLIEESKSNLEMKTMIGVARVNLMDELRDRIIREHRGVKEDVVTKSRESIFQVVCGHKEKTNKREVDETNLKSDLVRADTGKFTTTKLGKS